MLRAIHSFFNDRSGQELAEYCLMTALVVLIALGILVHVSGGLQIIWNGGGPGLTAGRPAIPPAATPLAAAPQPR